jgi:hypothetical protein
LLTRQFKFKVFQLQNFEIQSNFSFSSLLVRWIIKNDYADLSQPRSRLKDKDPAHFKSKRPDQGSLTEGEGSVQLASVLKSAPFYVENITYLFKKMICLNEEVSCTEPFPSVSIPWPDLCWEFGESVEHFATVLLNILGT